MLRVCLSLSIGIPPCGLLVLFQSYLAHAFIGTQLDLAVSVVPLLTAGALDPVLAIHLGVLSSIVVDLVAVVALHVCVELDEAMLTEDVLGAILEFHSLEDSCEDGSLQFRYNFGLALVGLPFSLEALLVHAQRAELVEALLHDLGDIANRAHLADRGFSCIRLSEGQN